MRIAAPRAVVAAGVAVAAATVAGFVVRAAAARPSQPESAAAAMTIVLAVAPVLAASIDLRDRDLRARLRAAVHVASVTWAAAAAAGLAAQGGTGSLGGALVPAAVAVLALGIAAALRALRVEPAFAGFAAAALACVPSALIFVADPWIEWDTGSLTSDADGDGAATAGVSDRPRRAHLVHQASPLAPMTSPGGGLGVDWQRMKILYDGPVQGVPGLSVVGQYYPSVPPRPFAWAGIVLGAGAALVAASRRVG